MVACRTISLGRRCERIFFCAPSRDASPVHREPIMHAELAVHVETTTISVAHWGRLLDGELFATSRYLQSAVLMKRAFRFDAL